jgi:hypothetical protein
MGLGSEGSWKQKGWHRFMRCHPFIFILFVLTFRFSRSMKMRASLLPGYMKFIAGQNAQIPWNQLLQLAFATMRIYLVFSVIHFFKSANGLSKVYSIGLKEPVHFNKPSSSKIPRVSRILYSSAFPLNILFGDNSLSTNN